MLCLKWLATRPSLWTPTLNSPWVYVGFVVDRMALWEVCLWVFQFHPVTITPSILHTHMSFTNHHTIKSLLQTLNKTHFSLSLPPCTTSLLCPNFSSGCTVTFCVWFFISPVILHRRNIYNHVLLQWQWSSEMYSDRHPVSGTVKLLHSV